MKAYIFTQFMELSFSYKNGVIWYRNSFTSDMLQNMTVEVVKFTESVPKSIILR